jgi:hypothetical protein
VSADLHSGSSAALKVFVIVCFVVWVAVSYLSLFALATVFWVAVLESRFHEGALVEYLATLLLTIVSAIASLKLWRRVHDRPHLYPQAAKAFAIVIGLGAVASAAMAAWSLLRR